MLARDENKSMSLPILSRFAHDKLSKEASLMQLNVWSQRMARVVGYGVPFGLTKIGI